MSDEVLAPIIAVVILLALFLWVPTLSICNDRCQKLLRGSSSQNPALESTQERDNLNRAA